MAWWIGAVTLALAALVAWSRLRVGFGFRLPEGGPPAVTVSALGLTFRRRLSPGAFPAAVDPGRLAAGFSELPTGEWLQALRRHLPLLRWFLKGVRVPASSLRARLGTGEAASTGMLIGWCWAGAGLLTAFTGARPRLEIQPVYGRIALDLDFRVAVQIRVARLIVFTLRMAWGLAPLVFRRIAGRRPSNISQERREGVSP